MATPTVTRDGDRLTVQVEITLGGSMLACEEAILDALNEAGAAATGEALERFAAGSSITVRRDLAENHARTVARSYLQGVAEAVGSVAQAKEEAWSYETPQVDGEVASIAIGLDGTCMLRCDEAWREAMTGTVSLYDGEGERQHTICLGAPPEYGKGRFLARLERDIEHVRSLYPSATYVGVADGAQCNRDFLGLHTDEQILDFYHASGYVADAAKAAHPKDTAERVRWRRERCHAHKHKQGAASRILKEMQRP